MLLNSSATSLAISLEFAKKKWGFKLKKIERPIYVRNIDGIFNKEWSIKHTVEVNIFYKRYRKKTEINMTGEQKWNIILGMSWLVCHNTEINWIIEEVRMMRCPEECKRR